MTLTLNIPNNDFDLIDLTTRTPGSPGTTHSDRTTDSDGSDGSDRTTGSDRTGLTILNNEGCCCLLSHSETTYQLNCSFQPHIHWPLPDNQTHYLFNLSKSLLERWPTPIRFGLQQESQPELPLSIDMRISLHNLTHQPTTDVFSRLILQNQAQALLLMHFHRSNSCMCPEVCCFKHYRNLVYKAAAILETEYTHPPCIHELSRRVGMSDTLLKKCFKLLYGKTIYQYVTEVRMYHAQELLKKATFSIGEVAEKVGYEHASHFSVAFKRFFAVSPKDFLCLH